jgi:hypothetical protein
MLERHPNLRERLLAASTFALIFLGGAAAFDFLVTNGLQWGSDPAPRAQVTMQAQSSATAVAQYYSPRAHERRPPRARAESFIPRLEALAGDAAPTPKLEDHVAR